MYVTIFGHQPINNFFSYLSERIFKIHSISHVKILRYFMYGFLLRRFHSITAIAKDLGFISLISNTAYYADLVSGFSVLCYLLQLWRMMFVVLFCHIFPEFFCFNCVLIMTFGRLSKVWRHVSMKRMRFLRSILGK